MRIPWREAAGKTVVCPQCRTHAPCSAMQPRIGNAAVQPHVAAAHTYVIMDCPRCGKKLYPQLGHELVELAPRDAERELAEARALVTRLEKETASSGRR